MAAADNKYKTLHENINCDLKPKSNKDETDTSSLLCEIKKIDDLYQEEYKSESSEQSISKKYVINSNSSVTETREIGSNEAVGDEEISIPESFPSSIVFKHSDEDYRRVLDNDIGDPLTTQCLRLDFTPIVGVDDDRFTSKKCLDFWKFIEAQPELKSLKVKPVMRDLNAESVSSVSQSIQSDILKAESDILNAEADVIKAESNEIDNKFGLPPLTVMSVNWLKKENIMAGSLMTNQRTGPPCEPWLDKYDGYRERNAANWPIVGAKKKPPLERKPCNVTMSPRQDDINELMAEMNKWDLEHPKTLEPLFLSGGHKSGPKRSILPSIDRDNNMNCEKCLN